MTMNSKVHSIIIPLLHDKNFSSAALLEMKQRWNMTIGSGWIIFLALLLTGFGVPLNDNLLDNFVKVVLEQFKGLMTTGLPELNIPVLDPFDVPHFNIPHIS